MFSSTLTVVQSSRPFLRLLGLASSRALARGLVLCLLHSEALDPRGFSPSTLIVSPCFTRPRFQLGVSSRAPPIPPDELDQHGPFGHGLHSSQCTQPCKCFNVAISQAMNVVVLGRHCCPASNSAVSLFVRSESWCRLLCLFRQTTRHHLLALNHEIVLALLSSLH